MTPGKMVKRPVRPWKDAHHINHRETQVETTVRHDLTPTKMAVVKRKNQRAKTRKQQVSVGMW